MSQDPSSDCFALVVPDLGAFAPEPAQDAESMKPTFDFELDPFPSFIGEMLSSIPDSNPNSVYVPFSPARGIFPHRCLHKLLLSGNVVANYSSPRT
jgi:hypothetical protein